MSAGQQHEGFYHGPDLLRLLNRDIANEMNTMLMYLTDSLTAKGTDALDVRDMAEKFTKQDFAHARKIAARIVELKGEPQLMPIQIQDNASIPMRVAEDGSVKGILKNALENELQAVLEYRNQVQRIAFEDPATRLLLEEILVDKEHQVEEIRTLLGM